MSKIRTPKWDKWRHIPDATPTECIALSVNIEPDDIHRAKEDARYGGRYNRSLSDRIEIYDDRMLTLERNFFLLTMRYGFNRRHANVPMERFLHWAFSEVGWEMPEEFVSFVSLDILQSPFPEYLPKAAKPADSKASDNKGLSKCEEKTYLNIIAALVNVSLGKEATIDAPPAFKSQESLMDYLDEQYKGYQGLSKRTLTRKFSAAKQSLKDS